MSRVSLKRGAKHLLWKASSRLYRRLVPAVEGQTYAIGIYEGPSPLELAPARGLTNPVLTAANVDDVPASFVADPFMIRRQGGWTMFLEVMNASSHLGQIACATSADGRDWSYQQVVLSEPFHLAYPHVFEWRGDVYMVPDSPGNGIRLYRARDFPFAWEFVAHLYTGNIFSDTSLFEFDGRWWMFSGWVEAKGQPMSLRLFSARDPLSRWREHPSSPVVARSPYLSRPAGRVQVIEGVPHRFAQDCVPSYGHSVHALRIDRLSRCVYHEQETSSLPLLGPGQEWWHAGGMHHVDAHPTPQGWLACVDGWHSGGNG